MDSERADHAKESESCPLGVAVEEALFALVLTLRAGGEAGGVPVVRRRL